MTNDPIQFSWKGWYHLEYAQFNQNCKVSCSGFFLFVGLFLFFFLIYCFKNFDNKFNFDQNHKRTYDYQNPTGGLLNSCD